MKPLNPYGLIGSSPAIQLVWELINKVSVSDSTVLLLGETGTGKEIVAKALHDTSKRNMGPLIKVNCAALPAYLVESELFGHEKGSFTGATDQRIGRFENADQGTLFLDEIGEMQPDMQVKLLRALQEKEIERIGSKSPIKTNVRIIAATNRDLESEVVKGRFRNDLYYRINVFPIELPPLRERKEDIPELVDYFLEREAANKKRQSLSPTVLQSLIQYNWPGNIRELEHVIERAVLMNNEPVINHINLPNLKQNARLRGEEKIKTLEEVERDYILFVLGKSNGKLRGKGGAAELLQIAPSTLQSKMKKLGIRKVAY